MKFVRIRPYNKRRGQLVRRYVYGGFRFEADHGWYEVENEIADYLKKVLTFPEDPDSKPVFDVTDQAGAEDLARKEYEAVHPETKISEATAGRQKVKLGDLNLKGTAQEKAEGSGEKDEPKEPEKKDEPKSEGEKKETSEAPENQEGPAAPGKTKTPPASGKSGSEKGSDK